MQIELYCNLYCIVIKPALHQMSIISLVCVWVHHCLGYMEHTCRNISDSYLVYLRMRVFGQSIK